MLVFQQQEDILTIKPNLASIVGVDARGVIVTARGTEHDFVSRFFAPAVGVTEYPVCGSAYTTLTPYWAKQLNKREGHSNSLKEAEKSIFNKKFENNKRCI